MAVRYRCDDCDQLVTITPTGRRVDETKSSEYWEVTTHWSERTGQPCPGSRRLV